MRVLDTSTCSLKKFPSILAVQANDRLIAVPTLTWRNAATREGEVNGANNVQDMFHLQYTITFICVV